MRSAPARTEATSTASWLWLACRLAPDLWDDELWHTLATHGLRVARESGALSLLPIAASYRAAVHVHAGAFDAASALIEEADAITQLTGIAPVKFASLRLAAWRGDEAEALELMEAGRREATARGEGLGLAMLEWNSAVLYNGLARHGEALVAARRASAQVEAGVSAGAAGRARRGRRSRAAARPRPPAPSIASASGRKRAAPTGRSASRPGRARC